MQTHKTILGISPETRSIGFALLRNGDLVNWHIRSFKGKWSLQKEQAILDYIKRTIERNGVEIVAVKSIDTRLASGELMLVVRSIQSLCVDFKIKFIDYSIKDLKKYYSNVPRGGKELLFAYIKQRFPELLTGYEKKGNDTSLYYTKMVEAIIAAQYVQEIL